MEKPLASLALVTGLISAESACYAEAQLGQTTDGAAIWQAITRYLHRYYVATVFTRLFLGSTDRQEIFQPSRCFDAVLGNIADGLANRKDEYGWHSWLNSIGQRSHSGDR